MLCTGPLGLSQSCIACTTLTSPLGPKYVLKHPQLDCSEQPLHTQKAADASQCMGLAVHGTQCPSAFPRISRCPAALLADIQISTSSLPVPQWSWQVHTLPQHSPRIHFLLLLGLAASRVNLGQHLSIGFLFPSCHGWQKGMCQDSTEEPLTDEEGQGGNGGFGLTMSKLCTNTDPQTLQANVSKNQRVMYKNLLLSPKIAQIHLNAVGNSVFAFLFLLIAVQGFQNFRTLFLAYVTK